MYWHIRPEVLTAKSNEIGLLEYDCTLADRQSQMSQRNLLHQSAEMWTEAASSLKMFLNFNKNTQTLCHRWQYFLVILDHTWITFSSTLAMFLGWIMKEGKKARKLRCAGKKRKRTDNRESKGMGKNATERMWRVMWKIKEVQSAHNITLTMTCLLSWSLSGYHPGSGSRTSSPCDLAALGSHVHCLLLSSSCKHSSFMCSHVSSHLRHTPRSSSTELFHTVSTFNYKELLLLQKNAVDE